MAASGDGGMYFPRAFDIDRAVELAELVDQAYAQFEAFSKGEAWKLTGDYRLQQVVNYTESSVRTGSATRTYFDLDLHGSRRGGHAPRDVPVGFTARRRDDVYLILRGTMTAREWIRDFRMGLVPYLLPRYGRVHDGFMHIYSMIRPTVQETLALVDHGKRLFIAGHSLGGALSTLALPDIGARMERKAIWLYTYGSPRVGDNGFAVAFNSDYRDRSFRILNTSDIVGSLPLPAPIMGIVGGYFSHIDTPVDFTTQTDDLEKNHLIKTYLSALKENGRSKGILSKLRLWGE